MSEKMRKTIPVIAGPVIAGFVLLAALGWLVYGSFGSVRADEAKPAAPAIPVTAGTAETRDVPIFVSGIGTVQAFNTVTVKSRVDGQIVKVDFTEGQEVKAGDLLFGIDPRPYQAAVAQAVANQQKDQAQLVSAQADLRRDEALIKNNFQTRQAYDQQKALVGQLQASIKADQAQIETAQLNLQYASIRSPIDGRTGARLVDIGNLVHAADNTALVTITQLRPIFVSFTVPQSELETIRQSLNAGAVTAEAYSENSDKKLADGQLSLIDNTIDQATGTIHLKARFANDKEALWPGAFVVMRLIVGEEKNAVVVPDRAIEEGPNGNYVFVIKPDMTVEMRPVTVSQSQQNLSVITKGLTAGERIVVDGQYRLDQGTRVSIEPSKANSAS